MLGYQTLRKRWLYLHDLTFGKLACKAHRARQRRVPAGRTALYIAQAVLSLASLACMVILSIIHCWNPEPGVQGYMWWLVSATPLFCIVAWLFETFSTQPRDPAAAESLSFFAFAFCVCWAAGVGCSAKIFTMTKKNHPNCRHQSGPWPENGALVALSVFQTLLFMALSWWLLEDDPYPPQDPLELIERNNNRSYRATRSNLPKPHLKFSDFREYITVHVGEGDNKKDYPIPKGLLCRRSKFINSAVSAEWTARLGRPQKVKEVDLSDDDPDIFEIYLLCVLGNVVTAEDLDYRHPTRIQSDDVFARLICTYVLADKLGDPQTTNMIADRMARYSEDHRRVPKAGIVAYACEATVKTSPLRTLLLDMFHAGFDTDATKEENMQSMPQEFLVRYMSERTPAAKFLVVGDDKYHQRVPD